MKHLSTLRSAYIEIRTAPRRRAVRLLCAAGLVGACSGCVMESQARERYFQSHLAMVESSPGDGSTRVSLWPNSGNIQTALADRSSAHGLDTSIAAVGRDGE